MAIVLASASPRRQELMRMLGVDDFRVIVTRAEEAPVFDALGPEARACHLALAKAWAATAASGPSDIVIGADTLVYLDGHILEKPRDMDHAHAMLRRLAGQTHQVYTGVAVLQGSREDTRCAVTHVRFRDLTDGEICAYLRRSQPLDKAGAYGIQDCSALFVEGIEGDFYNVMGLPLCLLGQMLSDFGVDLLLGEGVTH